VSANVAAADTADSTAVSVAGAVTFRLTRVVGLEVEASVVPRLGGSYPGATIQTDASGSAAAAFPSLAALGLLPPGLTSALFPAPHFENARGRLVVLSNNVRLAIPTTNRRLEPYVVAGGGVAHTRRTADLVIDFSPLIFGVPAPEVPFPRTIRQAVTQSSTDLALTLGGGLSIRVTRGVSIDGDLRLIRLMGDSDQNVGRFGVGVRYRF
jgi:opacity protein-like surface antigen